MLEIFHGCRTRHALRWAETGDVGSISLREPVGLRISTGGAEQIRLTLGHQLDKAGYPGVGDAIDEFRLLVYPVILGAGRPFFPLLDTAIHVEQVETRRFDASGVVYLRYRKIT